jgi:membrane-bound lytic murein transglycosylase D
MRKMRGIAILMILSYSGLVKAENTRDPFPVSDTMAQVVQFWVDVFTKYSIHQKIVYDSQNPLRIYTIVDFREYGSGGKLFTEERAFILKSEKAKVVSVLSKLGSKSFSLEELSGEETRIYRLFGDDPKNQDFLNAIPDIAMQGGMKEAFLDGIHRSGRYLYAIKKTFRDKDLPEQLVYLPHIESSFHPHAYSRSGAVGLWQFTRNTGKSYLTIRTDIDERSDPFLSSEAAAKLLKQYYRRLGSWPLAITAYNHGLGGITRAVRRLGTKDLDTIISKYKSRRFGFASKNFYAEFIAAVRVATNPDKYYETFTYAEPYQFKLYALSQPAGLGSITKTLGVSEDEIKQLNPALQPPILRGEKLLPKDYCLRLPVQAGPPGSGKLSGWISQLTKNPDSDSLNVPEQAAGRVLSFTAVEGGAGIFQDSEDKEPVSKEADYLRNSDVPILSFQSGELESYTVIRNKLTVQPEETLGHYADWLEIPTNQLRKFNGMRYDQRIRVGQSLQIPFGTVSKKEFEERRVAYHAGIRKSFYDTHRIDGSRIHEVRRGETLWIVANRKFDVPLWLLVAYNHFRDLNRLKPGEKVTIPVISKIQMNTDL